MEPKDFLYENAKALFNNAPFGYFSCNKDLVLISANNTFLQWINCPTDIQNGDKKLSDFFSGEALDQLEHLYLPTLFSQGFVKDFAITLTVPNAHRIALLLNSDVCKDEAENILLIRTTASTITHEDAAFKKTEGALIEANLQLELAQKVAKTGHWTFDPQTEKYNFSKECLRIFGFDNDFDGSYAMFMGIIHPDDLDKLVETRERIIAGETTFQIDHRIILKDGSIRWINTQSVVDRNDTTGQIFLRGTSQDITDRKKVEEKVSNSEEKYRLIVETAQEGIWMIDKHDSTTFVNGAMANMLGYTVDEMMGKELFYFMDEAGRKLALENIEKRKKGIPEQHEFCFITKKNTQLWVLLETGPMYKNGEYDGALAMVMNINNRKKADEQIKKLNEELEFKVIERTRDLQLITERFSMAKKAAHIGVFDWDVVNNVLVWDEEMYEVFNVPSNKFTGAYEAWEATVHPDDKDDSNKKVQEALESGNDLDFDFRIIWPNKSIHFIKGYGFVQKNEMGAPIRLIGMNWDITNQKSLELRLEKSKKELEAFSYSVSHDLRAPLRGIDGWSLALLEDYGHLLDETAMAYLERVRTETQRMGVLIDEMLKLSQIAKTALKRELVNMSVIANSIINRIRDLGNTPPIIAHISDNLITEGDANLLEIMLTNLIHNAVKFSSKKEEVTIYFGKIAIEGKATFYIKDRGVGFSMDKSKKLFGAFQRMHKQSDFEGTGIGLATVQRIISMHQGNVWAEAEINNGATFFFTLHE